MYTYAIPYISNIYTIYVFIFVIGLLILPVNPLTGVETKCNLAIRLAGVQAGSCACVWGCVQVGKCAGRQLCMCVGVRVQASVHAEIGACMLGFLGCWVARSPGFLCSWVAMVILGSWVAGLLGC